MATKVYTDTLTGKLRRAGTALAGMARPARNVQDAMQRPATLRNALAPVVRDVATSSLMGPSDNPTMIGQISNAVPIVAGAARQVFQSGGLIGAGTMNQPSAIQQLRQAAPQPAPVVAPQPNVLNPAMVSGVPLPQPNVLDPSKVTGQPLSFRAGMALSPDEMAAVPSPAAAPVVAQPAVSAPLPGPVAAMIRSPGSVINPNMPPPAPAALPPMPAQNAPVGGPQQTKGVFVGGQAWRGGATQLQDPNSPVNMPLGNPNLPVREQSLAAMAKTPVIGAASATLNGRTVGSMGASEAANAARLGAYEADRQANGTPGIGGTFLARYNANEAPGRSGIVGPVYDGQAVLANQRQNQGLAPRPAVMGGSRGAAIELARGEQEQRERMANTALGSQERIARYGADASVANKAAERKNALDVAGVNAKGRVDAAAAKNESLAGKAAQSKADKAQNYELKRIDSEIDALTKSVSGENAMDPTTATPEQIAKVKRANEQLAALRAKRESMSTTGAAQAPAQAGQSPTATGPNGEKYVLQNGAWVQVQS